MADSQQTSDLDEIWQAALTQYKEATNADLGSLTVAESVDDILLEINESDKYFEKNCHDGSKLDTFRTLVSESLQSIQTITEDVSGALSEGFLPRTTILTAVRYMMTTAKHGSADYNKLTEFFNDLLHHLKYFKFLLEKPAPGLEIKNALVEVLSSVLQLCAFFVKRTKASRMSRAWRSLAGEDKELTEAYDHFHEMVDNVWSRLRLFTAASLRDIQEDLRKSEFRNALDDLSTLDFNATQREKMAKHQSGTCQWFIDHEVFEQWFSAEEASTLWCYGDPGCGKTILTFPLPFGVID
ncbi:hypothetical protein N7541_002926 [Penicillium brevicompactum]|uniref:Fungal STAND N-terminal Goodbye domain-containing protein n=1 Tax=Penicillium brevicompactum TaxID=5074 RepID=A0A9W9UYF8_PENBR|nr:hypothetical protein N7541_002926 [Penicillium brevicompactum]